MRLWHILNGTKANTKSLAKLLKGTLVKLLSGQRYDVNATMGKWHKCPVTQRHNDTLAKLHKGTNAK